jgi:hypothetical protein
VTAPALPDCAPVPRSSLGPALNDQGYYVGRVERNLYWVTFQDRYTLEVAGERAELAWHGPNHPPDNIFIHVEVFTTTTTTTTTTFMILQSMRLDLGPAHRSTPDQNHVALTRTTLL